MKRLISFAILSLLCFSLGAIDGVWMGLTPREGAFGVNLASDKYRSNNGKKDGLIEDGTDYWDGGSISTVPVGDYCDQAIISIGSINDKSRSEYEGVSDGFLKDSKTMEVEISCSNTDFCFVSESNPTYRRPFELMLFYAVHEESSINERGYKRITSTDNKAELKTERMEHLGLDRSRLSFTHFDLVLVLPPLDDNGELWYNNRLYPLINADDYTANVTITLTSGDAEPTTQVLTIPFSGFFHGADNKSELPKADAINISINRYPSAANLNIKALSDPSVASQELPVARINMMYFWGKKDDRPSLNDVKMFFSASNDATSNTNERGFEFVHSSVGYSTIHNQYNSIGYTISAKSFHGNGYTINNPEGLTPTENREYSGEEYLTEGGSLVSHDASESPQFIYPTIHEAQSSMEDNPPTYYCTWESDVMLKMDKRADTEQHMFAGRYTSTVYFHVVAP